MVSLAKERQQTHEPVAAAEKVRRMSMCLQDLRRTSRDWRTSDPRPAAERRKSVLDVIGSMDEGFTALSWSVSAVFLDAVRIAKKAGALVQHV